MNFIYLLLLFHIKNKLQNIEKYLLIKYLYIHFGILKIL